MLKFKKFLAILLAATLIIGNSSPVFCSELPVEGEIDLTASEAEPEMINPEIDSEIDSDIVIEESEDIEALFDDEDIEEPFPGVDDINFCSDPEIIEDKASLNEHLSDLDGSVPGRDFIEGEIIVAAPDEYTARIYAEAFGGRLGAFNHGFALIHLNSDNGAGEGETMSVMDAVLASADINTPLPAAWPNYIRYATEYVEESDLSLSSCFEDPDLDSGSGRYQWQHSLMQSEAAWRNGYKGQGIKLCVIDTGVIEHEDLIIAGKAYSDYNHEYEITEGDGSKDLNGHGTHCAGTSTARLNEKGGAGIAPEASLYVIKASTPDGGNSFGDYAIMNSIYYAVNEYNADIISMSLGAKAYSECQAVAVEHAYQSGVAIFAASGNDSSNVVSYPAAFEHAVAVGAVNQNNVITNFTDTGSKIRYSGPGYNVYSTAVNSESPEDSSCYKPDSGTSMATPCVAGAAAVILSSGKITGERSRKVDNLLAYMDKCTTKSGVGKGTPNLAKAFGISEKASAPNVPVVNENKPGVYYAEINVELKSGLGTKIYYNTDGKSISSKNGEILNAVLYEDPITLNPDKGGKQTIKAVAVDNDTMLCSKVASFTYTFKPKVSSITIDTKTHDFIVVKGKSLQLTASVSPSCAANKKVTWSIDGEIPKGIAISTAGKLTVAKTSTADSVSVKAMAADGSGTFCTKIIEISDAEIVKSIIPYDKTFYTYEDFNYVGCEIGVSATDKNNSPLDIREYLDLSVSNGSSTISASILDNYRIVFYPVSAGVATITLSAKDGSGKKATIQVTVLKRVSDVNGDNDHTIVQGGSYQCSASVSPENASDKSVSWNLAGVPAETTAKNCGVTVNYKTGLVKATKKAVVGDYKITAYANDGRGAYKTWTVKVKSASEGIKSIAFSQKSLNIFRVTNLHGASTQASIPVTVNGGDPSQVALTNSTPSLVNASISDGTLTVTATGKATGKATITVTSTDGTNKKAKITIVVTNPPSGLVLTLPKGRGDTLQYNKSLKLTPIFYTEYGAIDQSSKKLTWESSDPSLLSVSQNGTIKALNPKINPPCSVTITAKNEASGIEASFNMYLNPKVTKVESTSYYRWDTESNEWVAIDSTTVEKGDNNTYKVDCIFQTPYEVSVIDTACVNISVSGPKDGCQFLKNNTGAIFIFVKSGTYKFTYKLNDGSNIGYTVTWKVK